MRAPQEDQPRRISRRAILGGLVGAAGLLTIGCNPFGSEDEEKKNSSVIDEATIKEEIKGFTSAEKSGNEWKLKNPDGQEINMTLPDGFTPDTRLRIPNDLLLNPINQDLSVYGDWEKALNTGRPVEDRLAGYNYDYNDFCPTVDDKCNVQGDMWAWRVFQGQEVEVPGIGKLVGGPRRSVVLLFINLEDSVVAWDEQEGGLGQVKVKRGFTATGRIFDGGKLASTEENLAGHWLFKQANGDPSKSYIGITDSPDNARETLFVSAVRRQWGNNPDGTKRIQFQLMRAELVNFGKEK